MARNRILAAVAMTLGLTLVTGCGQVFFPAALDTTLEDVDRIRNDNALEPQEKRDALAALGIDEVTINGLMVGVRLGNQFGGDLASAIDKVASDQLTDMTPDEIQYYGDASDLIGYGDVQAQQILNLFRDEGLNSRDELGEFLDDPLKDVPFGIDETTLGDVFVDTSLDDVRDKLP